MRKAVWVTAILLIVFLIQSIAQMGAVEANPFLFGPYIGIVSPELFNKKTYQTSTIPIEVQIETPTDYPKIIRIYYILDENYSSHNNPQKQLSISNPQHTTFSGVQSISYFGTGTLENLSKGMHTLDAYAVDAQGKNIKSSTRNFLVNTTLAYPTATSKQPFAANNLTIVLVIVTIATIIGASLTVFAYKRRKKV